MATIQLTCDSPNTYTSISNIFIDQFMPEANGEFVKVYLFLLRSLNNSTSGCSISNIADCFNHTEKDVLRALKYWERMHLISLKYNQDKSLAGIVMLSVEAASDVALGYSAIPKSSNTDSDVSSVTSISKSSMDSEKNPHASKNQTIESSASIHVDAPRLETNSLSANTPADDTRKSYSMDEIKAFRKDPNIKELFFIIETYLKRTLTATDINTVLYWYDGLHLSAELIEHLTDYCISEGHSNIRYMDKVALNWHEAGITTVDQAKEMSATRNKIYYGVMKALGIAGRNLVDSEIALIRKWNTEYGYNLPFIQEACKRTISATNHPNFKYTDSIIENWHKNNVCTLEDIHRLDETYNKKKKVNTNTTVVKKNRFTNFEQRDYDYDQLENMLLNTNVK